MLHALLGLERTLADEDCERVELRGGSDRATIAFAREGEDLWGREGGGSATIHTQELGEMMRSRFGRAGDRLVCFLSHENVVYSNERGAVSITRSARDDLGADTGPAGASWEALTGALGIPRSRRGAKLKQAVQFGKIVEAALSGQEKKALRILDLACGRSYLGFVLVYLLVRRGRGVELHGVDANRTLVDKCREIVAALRWANSTFEVADLATYAVAPDRYDIVVSLHGCDTLTDEAIRIACEARTPLLFVAPCCQHELRHLWKTHPLQWISRYGLLEQRLADVLTDGFRCLVLEALGYRVKVLRFADPDITPKNLLIQAQLSSGPKPDRARAAWAFLKQFGVRPRLASVLEAAGLEER